MSLLTTKLHMPSVRYNFVTRLLNQLDRRLQQKLTLVSAPAGFGKSALLADWLAGRCVHAAWLSLDKGDNDPIRFWSYIVATLQSD